MVPVSLSVSPLPVYSHKSKHKNPIRNYLGTMFLVLVLCEHAR